MQQRMTKTVYSILSHIGEGIPGPLHALYVLFFQQRVDCLQNDVTSTELGDSGPEMTHLLDVWDLRGEALRDLGNDLLDEGLVLHGLDTHCELR